MLTPRDSEAVLDTLDRLEREATVGPWQSRQTGPEHWYPFGPDTLSMDGEMSYADAELIALSRNHLRALLDVARAAQAHYDEWASINAFEHLPLPIQAIGQALAPLTPPSEQKEET